MSLFNRLLQAPTQSFFLFGPRGSGKSTWLRTCYPEAHWVDLLREDLYQRFLAQPASFAMELEALRPGSWVVVDEVQRLPNLLNEVHRLMEGRKLQFCLCGSSARKLNRAGVNLLGGRALRRAMHPFLPSEMGEAFSLSQAQQVGLLPVVWGSPDKAGAIDAYAQLYLKEEIQAEALVRNLPGFARFLPIAALYHGQTLNVSNIARESGVSRMTVAGYLDILEQTLLCFRLPAYESRLRVRERQHPKWYWCDLGIVRAMKKSKGDLLPEERGALFEGLVAQTLRAYRDYSGLFDSLFYWAPAESRDTEVDFLLARGDRFVAVEVKTGSRFQEFWCRGLRACAPLKGLGRRFVVCPESPLMKTSDGIEVVSYEAFEHLLHAGGIWNEPA
jgi:predicted AAA+ superfamily ATPase